MTESDAVPLDLLERATVRKRALGVGIAGLVVGAALGGVVGLFAGSIGFLITVGIVALPLLVLAYGESRKTAWLRGTVVSVQAFGTRRVELHTVERLDVLVTDMRGMRTVSLLAGGAPRGKVVTVSLAMYAGIGGKELGVYALRRLADALASVGHAHALALSELIVAQLKAEARGDGAADRPLYRLASLAPQGRMAQRLHPDAVARFVAALD